MAVRVTILALLGLLTTGSQSRSPVTNQADGQSSFDLKLVISLEKEHFLLGEPVWVHTRLINTGCDTVLFGHNRLCIECDIIRFDVTRDGTTLKYAGPVALWMAIPTPLRAGQEIRSTEDLLVNYGTRVKGTRMPGMMISPGTYTVTARVGEIASNTREFAIEEPAGAEKEIYDAMIDGLKLMASRQRNQAFELLTRVLSGATTSVYRDKIYMLRALSRLYDKEEHVAACRQMIEDNYDTPYAEYGVLGSTAEMSLEEVEAFLEEINSKAPDSRTAGVLRDVVKSTRFRSR